MPQLRQNIITGEWVVIAPERAKRPIEFVSATEPKTKTEEHCVFCPYSANYKKERLHHYETDNIYVIPNKFPAFVENPHLCQPRSYQVENNFFTAKPALGGHDVVVIKDHTLSPGQFSATLWKDLFVIFRHRYKHYDKVCNVQSTIAIYNNKSAAGASIVHPHAQIFASSIIPNLVSRELHETSDYWERNGISAFEKLVVHERLFKHRVIYENDHFLAFTQYAAKYPFETWIVPKIQRSHFEHASNLELAAAAITMHKVIGKLDNILKNPAFNLYIHSAPHTLGRLDYYRWHIEIAPRLSTFGGYELGSGMVIDTISPEIAADFLNGKAT
ncbi:MAG TPA: galactose-1-phosphate uridylyltransferase [Candidatus Saccharimonadales bacterium]|nr:galactose-1-phosphate uridylyltransferase [Candidatus Saccharimonadales bacterium]